VAVVYRESTKVARNNKNTPLPAKEKEKSNAQTQHKSNTETRNARERAKERKARKPEEKKLTSGKLGCELGEGELEGASACARRAQ
jgi:hypothetical protein